jgi:hypothetical protein
VRKVLGEEPESLYVGVPERRWQAFEEYPLKDFMLRALNAARLLHPKRLGDADFEVSWWSRSGRAGISTLSGLCVLKPLVLRVARAARPGN